MKRAEARWEDTWALEDLYETEARFLEEEEQLKKEIRDFIKYQGRLTEGAGILFEALEAYGRMNLRFERVYVYANQSMHQDMGNSHYQEMALETQNLMNGLNQAVSFLEPEILRISQPVLDGYYREEAGLEKYRRFLDEILRRKPHTLSAEMEALMARVGELGQAPSNIFAMFHNADITFSTIQDENGKEAKLTQGSYIRFLESKSRRVRRDAFTSLYQGYANFQNTLAAVYEANTRQAAFFARERSYGSALEAALDDGNIPVSVYENLIEAVNRHLDLLHRYMEIRKKRMGLEELHMYDLYTPMVPSPDKVISFEQAKRMVREGLAPLGEDYQALLQEGYDSRWIDVYENEGKRTGAYSWGAYGTHPYVLLNYQGNLNSVFTLAHEMGHALHSYYSDHTQEYLYAGYRIFVAEVASTCNEALLIHHLLENASSEEERLYLVNYFLEQFRTTLYRQTMFAEFEKITHQRAAEGQPLTADVLCEIYADLNRKYFGAGVVMDQQIRYEWERIPHFYTPFYVYQYATGFSAAIAISSKILRGEPGMVEKYKKFLSGGSSMDPIDLLKICGVDMTTPQPVEEALQVFAKYLEEMK